ncbi:MAG: VOC family protein [Verrucomicrobiales bacterium]|nr:VOC family protein [Verrucomicrobiales bacterium]
MITGLAEIILYVQDMESQVAFYRDVLKLPIDYPEQKSYENEQWVVFGTGGCKLALHGGGRKKFGRDAPKFVFEVDDVQRTREFLSLSGVPVGKIRHPAPGVEVLDAEDPEGNQFSVEHKEPDDKK